MNAQRLPLQSRMTLQPLPAAVRDAGPRPLVSCRSPLFATRWPAPRLLYAGYGAMAAGAMLAFAPWTAETSAGVAAIRYAGVLMFSAVGGLVPGTLFSLAVRLAPDDATVSTT